MTRQTRTIFSNTYETLSNQFDVYPWNDHFTADELQNLTDDDKWQIIYDDNDFYFDDTLQTLKEIDKLIPNRIIAVANVGTWRGRVTGYKWVGNTDNIIYTMSSCDSIELYSDGYNICMDGYHHDGHNHCIFRMIKDDVSDEVIDRLEDALYSGNAEKADYYIRKYTKSLLPMFRSQFYV